MLLPGLNDIYMWSSLRFDEGGWTTLLQQSILAKKGGWDTKGYRGLSFAIKMSGGPDQSKKEVIVQLGFLSRGPISAIPP